ncbi:MAG: hypothetical protein L0Y71_23735 [Gemmataceae bacterium]|nr:hypothetical protein [Gemmataceae bacterium]
MSYLCVSPPLELRPGASLADQPLRRNGVPPDQPEAIVPPPDWDLEPVAG